ncbi:MAG: CAP domain-containing protein [Lutibacter sp.]|uniref:CAP domain-containing protein n=1 Tax=Lutibacter sp. TaxID=1925666 RepID=UPI003859681F
MKSFTLKPLVLILFMFVFFSCSKEDDGIYFNETNEVVNTNVNYSNIEIEILDLVNDYRQSMGLNTLETLNIISGVADGHTNYMVETGQVSHDNFSQRAEILINNAGAKTVGENVAYGFNTAQGVLNGWLNSEEHKKIIENPSYTHFGISTESNNEGRKYFTQIFIKK